jgi:putative adhesin
MEESLMRTSMSWLGVLVAACTGCAHLEMREKFEQSFEQSVEGPVSRIEVDTSSGFVHIRGVPGAKLNVRGRITAYARSAERARELAGQIAQAPPVERSGKVLHVGGHLRQRPGFAEGISIDYELTVPPELEAVVDSSSGDVEVNGLQGAVQVNSSSGDVKLSQVGAAKVDSSSGDVVLEEIGGDIDVDSSSGDVKILASPGPHARWVVDASSGDVILAVAPHAAFHLHAATSSGRVKTDLPIRVRGSFDSNELHGIIGEGPSEAEVKIGASSGDIRILQQEQPRAQASD